MAGTIFSLLDEDHLKDPFPKLAKLRENDSVHWDAALEFLPPDAHLLDDETEWETIGLMRGSVNMPVYFG